MRVFRIGSTSHPIFDGGGAAKTGGRWNKIGQSLIYCAESLALCQIEMLVHIGRYSDVPANHVYCEIHVPENICTETLNPVNLPPGWNNRFDYSKCQKIGSEWITGRTSAVMRVPSVTTSDGYCILINPNHHDFQHIKASEPRALEWDERLFVK